MNMFRSPYKLLAVIGAIYITSVALVVISDGPLLLTAVFTPIGGLTGIAVVAGPILRWRAIKIFEQQIDLHQSVEISWDQEGFRASTSNAQSITPWGDFVRFRETARMLLLYRSDVIFHMIPTRAFENREQLNDFRSYAQRIGA